MQVHACLCIYTPVYIRDRVLCVCARSCQEQNKLSVPRWHIMIFHFVTDDVYVRGNKNKMLMMNAMTTAIKLK